MDQLRGVLRRRRNELVSLLVLREGFDIVTATRFVTVAGDDLLECCSWRSAEPEAAELTEDDRIRELLGFIHANRIASHVGIPTPQVWQGLRTLVPSVVRLAGGASARLRSA